MVLQTSLSPGTKIDEISSSLGSLGSGRIASIFLHLSSDASCRDAVLEGAIEAVVAAMDRNMLSSSVQQNASGVLLNLSASGADAQSSIVQAGGIESIV